MKSLKIILLASAIAVGAIASTAQARNSGGGDGVPKTFIGYIACDPKQMIGCVKWMGSGPYVVNAWYYPLSATECEAFRQESIALTGIGSCV